MIIPLLFAIVAFSFAGSMLWHKHKAALARTAMMAQLAKSLGLNFSEQDSFGLSRQLKDFELFRRERSRFFNHGKQVTNIMRGWVGETEVYLFDYSYTVQAGKSRKTISQTVFFANDKNWFLPGFYLKPEKWWHKLQTKLGLSNDINFEENETFSEKYWLTGKFEDLIRQQFTPDLQGFLSEKPPAHMEGNNYYLIGYKPRKKMDAEEAKVFFRHCCEIVKMLQEKGNLELLDLAELKKDGILISSEK
jgi:hypothetical protein